MKKKIYLLLISLFFVISGALNAQSVADAGPDQHVCADSTYLDAVNVENADDQHWYVIEGNGVFENISDPHTKVTELDTGANVFVWEVLIITSGGWPPIPVYNYYRDTVIIYNDAPSQPDAGNDQTICANSIVLNANNPDRGTGMWSVAGGVNVIISDIYDSDAVVSNLPQGTTVLNWTITHKGCSKTDQVAITNDLPDESFAGYDQTLCASTTTLEATPVNIGTGSWSIVSSGSATIVSPNDPHSTVANLQQGTTIFRWTVTHNACSLYDEVAITNNLPDVPFAGNDQSICSDYTTLNANTPSIGVGQWSLVDNTAIIEDMDNPNTSVSSLGKGNVILRWTITHNGCSLYDDVVITNNLPDEPFAGYDKSLCADTTVLEATPLSIGNGVWILASGNAIFQNNNDPHTFVSGLSQGENVFVWMAENNGCVLTDTVIITNNLPDVPFAGDDQIICADNTILNANTPTIGEGFWSVISGNAIVDDTALSSSTVSQLSQGENILRWTIRNFNCVLYDDVVIRNDLPDAAFAGYDKVICYDSLTLEATPVVIGNGYWTVHVGGGIFSDSSDSHSLVTGILQGDNIYVWHTEHNGCQLSDTVYIRNDRPSIPEAGVDSSICSDSIVLYANSPVIGYGEWSIVNGFGIFSEVNNPTSVISSLPLGPTTLRWTIRHNDCVLSDDVVITNDLPSVPIGGGDYFTCSDSLQLGAMLPSVGYGLWSSSDSLVFFSDSSSHVSLVYHLPQGIDTLYWTTYHNNCLLVDTVYVYSSQLIDSIRYRDLSCYMSGDGEISVDIFGGFGPYTYNWSNNTGILPYIDNYLSGLPSDTYYLEVIDSIGCLLYDSLILHQPSKIEGHGLVTHVLCHGDSSGSIELFTSGGVGGYSYNWWIEYDSTHYNVLDSTSSHLYNMLSGLYGVEIIDSSGCSVEEHYEIYSPTQLSLSAEIVDNVCYDGYEGIIDLSVEGGTPSYYGYSYLWREQNDSLVHYYDSTFVSTEEDLYNLHAGTYSVTVTDLNGCEITGTFKVSEPFEGILLEGELEEVSCKDQRDGSIDLTVSYGTPPYTYLWSNGSTEEDLDSLAGGVYIVTVTDIYGCFAIDTFTVTVNSQECLHVYNAFSPNGDGVNDYWTIENISLYPDCIVKVYNQWGNLVFYSEGYSSRWDGTYNGIPLPSGTYYYIIDLGNGDVPYRGDVTIIR